MPGRSDGRERVDRSRSKRHGEMQREQRRRDRGDEAREWNARLGSVPTLHSRVRLERRESTAMCAVRAESGDLGPPFRFVDCASSQKIKKDNKVQKRRGFL